MRFILPVATTPSGGHAYNRAILDHWPHTGVELVETSTQAQLAGALDAPAVVLDGLIGAPHPDLIEAAVADGTHVTLLIHLPLADEGGLTDTERERLASLERRSVLAASQVIVTSRTAAEDLEARYGRAVVAVPPGATPGPVSTPNEVPHIVQIGSIGPRKNQLATAKALRYCQDLPWRATFVGPVTDEDYAAELDVALPPNAVRREAMSTTEISELLRGADLLVHPAEAETFGMVIAEAVAHGVPALVTTGTGATEALATGTREGDQVPGQAVNPADLPTALRTWLTDATRRRAWREAALGARDNLRGWDEATQEFEAASRPPLGERIAADWLALRRSADTHAREASLPFVRRCAEFLGGGGTAIDVGAGTGANHAYLAPHFPGTHWILLDHDRDLLDQTDGVERVVGGIEELPRLIGEAQPPVLVTASALLDLLSESQLDQLALHLRDAGAIGLFALSVDGGMHLDPPHQDDALVLEAFNAHQRRRARPGPEAPQHLAHRCRQVGLSISQATTPWQLTTSPLTDRLLRERAAAAMEAHPEQAGRIDAWLATRLSEPLLQVQIGHVDLLVEPT